MVKTTRETPDLALREAVFDRLDDLLRAGFRVTLTLNLWGRTYRGLRFTDRDRLPAVVTEKYVAF